MQSVSLLFIIQSLYGFRQKTAKLPQQGSPRVNISYRTTSGDYEGTNQWMFKIEDWDCNMY